MDITDIKYEQVADICRQMHELNARALGILNEIKTSQEKVVYSWSSPAQREYTEEFNKLKTQFDILNKELEYAIVFMITATGNYEKIDKNLEKDIITVLGRFSLEGSTMFSKDI